MCIRDSLASADQNPIMLPRLVAFLGMNSRYKHKHMKSGNRLANAWKAYVETQVITVESLQSRRIRVHRGIDVIHATLTLGKTVLGGKKMDPYLKSLRDTRRQIRAQEITLDKSGSYTHLRAHETPEHLVCRLLLEKKKK